MSRPTLVRGVPADALAFNLDEAAARISVSRGTLENLVATGQIKSFLVGRRRLVSRVALEAFVRKMERAA